MPDPTSSSPLCLGLMRHSLAAKRDNKLFPDDDLRPLLPKGRKLAKKVAKSWLSLGFEPRRIFTSPLPRALETAEIVAESLGLPGHKLRSLPVLRYDTDPHVALRYLATLPLRGHVLLVGHEPWLGELLSLLVSGRVGKGLPFRKCGWAWVECDSLLPAHGQLKVFLPPC